MKIFKFLNNNYIFWFMFSKRRGRSISKIKYLIFESKIDFANIKFKKNYFILINIYFQIITINIRTRTTKTKNAKKKFKDIKC